MSEYEISVEYAVFLELLCRLAFIRDAYSYEVWMDGSWAVWGRGWSVDGDPTLCITGDNREDLHAAIEAEETT